MSINDVQNKWPTYQLLVKTMYMGINDPQLLKTAVANFGPFPDNDPDEWDIWLKACEGLGALDTAVQVTDAALKQEIKFVSATNAIAAAIKLAAPSQGDIKKLIDQLQVINDSIKKDQRFAEALKIGKAVAANMSTVLKKQ